MLKYRIKEKNNYFYPQYKNGWKTLWTWDHLFKYEPYYLIDDYIKVRFDNIDDANEYCIKHKNEHSIKIHNIKK